MMKYIQIVGLLVIFCTLCEPVLSQTNAEERARTELNRKGLDEAAVRERLAKRGVDLDNINPDNPGQVFAAEKALREVIAELEAEQVSKGTTRDTIKPLEEISDQQAKELARGGEDISDAIKEGATLEEAVSEELIEGQEEKLPPSEIYGQHIFRSQSIKLYRKSEDVKPPDTYILGVGDKIGISIWGYSQENIIFEINSAGFIKPEGIPRIYLKGIKFGEARVLLESRFSNYYRFRPQEFEVTLNFGRTINVNIVGEVFNYGSFNIPAINSAYNALVAAGGPSNIGSVRKIQLLRAGEAPKIIDIYKYLLDPNIQEDLYLEENDFINVPTSERIINVKGAVKRPFKYELIGNENLLELIEFAGGLNSNAIRKNFQIKRYINDAEEIIDLNYEKLIKSGRNFDLLDGDVVFVNSIAVEFQNRISIAGAVDHPGTYAIVDNTKISDVLARVELSPRALTDIAFVKRLDSDKKGFKYLFINLNNAINKNPSDDIVLEPEDRIVIYEKSRYSDSYSFSVTGAVRSPGRFDYDDSEQLNVEKALFLAGGLRPVATDLAFIKRTSPTNKKEIEYIKIDLGNKSIISETFLQRLDELVIYSKETYSDETFVSIEGAVKDPGKFTYGKSLTVKDVVIMAGGFELFAAPYKIDVYRLSFDDKRKTQTLAAQIGLDQNYDFVSTSTFELQPFDQIYVRTAPEFELQSTVHVTGEVVFEGPYAIIKENQRISDLLEQAGGLTNEAFPEGARLRRDAQDKGFIVIKLDEIIKDKNSHYNIILRKGDALFIPKRDDIVTIKGATRAYDLYEERVTLSGPINVSFAGYKNAMYYINNFAGGITRHGDKSKITVTYPNGEVHHTRRFLFWKRYPKVMPGSIIKVGYKTVEEKSNSGNDIKTNWGQIFADSIAQATAILSLILLVQRID